MLTSMARYWPHEAWVVYCRSTFLVRKGCCRPWRYVILLLEHIVVTSLPPRLRLRKPGVLGPRIAGDPRYHVVVFSHREMWMQFSMAFLPGWTPAGNTPVIAMPSIAVPGSLLGNCGCACCAY